MRVKGSRVRNTRIWMQQCSIQSLLLHGSVCICSVPQLTDVKHGVKKAGKVPRGGGRVSHYRCVLWEMLRKEEGYNRPMQAMEPLGSTGMSLFPEPRAPVMPSSQPGPPVMHSPTHTGSAPTAACLALSHTCLEFVTGLKHFSSRRKEAKVAGN